MITFTPLSGAVGSSRTPLAYLLQVDDVRILLDCGSPDWAPEPSAVKDGVYPWEGYAQALRDCAPTVDLVLMSHGDLPHTGLYPYAYSRWNLKAPAYTTLPVQAMARMAASEDVEGMRDEEDFGDDEPISQDDGTGQAAEGDFTPESTPKDVKGKGKYVATLREVQDAFDSVNTLRYSQPTHLQGKCQGLTITPFNAGHTLGGTIWKIRSPSSGTILYAVNMNHMRERHLDGTVLIRAGGGGVFEPLARPDLLITDADRADVITSRRKDRDAALIDTITSTLQSRSSLLLPCDASTRVLELLVLLDQHWSFSRLRYPICFLSRTASEMLTFVRSMMEWLGGTLSKEDVGEDGSGAGGGRGGRMDRRGDHGRDNKRKRDGEEEDALGAFALRFRHLEFFPNPASLIAKYSSKDPKLILAVPSSLSHGPSRHLFTSFAAVPDNVVLLTSLPPENTLGRELWDLWEGRQRGEEKYGGGKVGSNVMCDGSIKVTLGAKVPLAGGELEEYLEGERLKREKEAAQQAVLERNQRILEADEDESDDEESDSDADEEEEEEVRMALGDSMMDMDGDVPQHSQNQVVSRRKKGEKSADAMDWNNLDGGDEGLTKQLLSFDIYIKGNVSKGTSFFKSFSNGSGGAMAQRFRMFPYVEKKRRVDEYGETIDVGMWLRKGKVFEEEAETEEVKDWRRRAEEDDKQNKVEEIPSKYVTSQVEVQMACRMLFVDMEGLNDGRAVKTIVPQVNPRKMIIVQASKASADALIQSCANIRTMTKDIFAPVIGESVQIGQQTNSFSISISDELLSSIKMSRFEDNEIGFVTGRVVTHASSTIPVLEPTSASPTLAIQSSSQPEKPRILGSRPSVTLPNSTMIGELKLTALKARLASIGVNAELVGEGVLICGARGGDEDGETVAVRKTGRGKVELEGNVSPVYYVVRKEVYGLHALVAA